jgi:hypothetical protein
MLDPVAAGSRSNGLFAKAVSFLVAFLFTETRDGRVLRLAARDGMLCLNRTTAKSSA